MLVKSIIRHSFYFFFFYFIYFLVKLLQYPIFLISRIIKPKRNTIIYLAAFFPENAGYNYRVKIWSEILEQQGLAVEIKQVFKKERFDKFLKENNIRIHYYQLILKLWHCIQSINYETVIVRRELLIFNDYGNLFLEKFLIKIHPNVILDFDDDIAASKNQPKKITNFFGKVLQEHGNKFNASLRIYKRFIVVSSYLKELTIKENPLVKPNSILVIPTCVNYELYPIKKYSNKIGKISFGWIGGNHNYYLLDGILPILNTFSEKYNFKLIVIGGINYQRDVNFEIEFIPWSIQTEIENLYKIDIGLMPLWNDDVSKGKGGFKLIQYMGLGIVSIASSITINQEIINNGVNSFLVENDEEWIQHFTSILDNKVNLLEVGENARNSIIENYSFRAHTNNYINFIKTCVE